MAANDVNLSKIARTFCSHAQVASNYKRLQRFIRGVTWCEGCLYRLAKGLFSLPESLLLAMDRTNWKFGEFNINILTIAIVYRGIAIPIMWKMLPKRGNSNYQERITLSERMLKVLGNTQLKGLLADREFVGKAWLAWLVKKEIPFVIRCKENTIASNTKGQLLPLSLILRNLKPGETIIFPRKRQIMSVSLHIVATRLEDGDLLILLTDANPHKALAHYALRWEIEQLFSCLKKRGFNFENTHLNKEERVSNLMVVLSIAFMCAYRQGEIKTIGKTIKLKKHGYAAKSLFRIGLEALANAIFNVGRSVKPLCTIVKKLFKPPETPKNQCIQGGVL